MDLISISLLSSDRAWDMLFSISLEKVFPSVGFIQYACFGNSKKSLKQAKFETIGTVPQLIASKTDSPNVSPLSAFEG